MNGLTELCIALSVVCIVASILELVVLFVASLNKKQAGAVGVMFNMVTMLLWNYISQKTDITGTLYYVTISVLVISGIVSILNFTLGIISIDDRHR